MENKRNFAYTFILSLSFLATMFLVWFIYFKPAASHDFTWVSSLPLVNACLNTLSSLFLITGYIFIKKKMVSLHIKAMSCATVTSALFLVSYLLYHHYHGDTQFIAQGSIRPVYFTILITHIFLSVTMLPLVLITLWNAFTSNFEKHMKWAKITLPIWLYVSVTGVLIYIFLNFWNN